MRASAAIPQGTAAAFERYATPEPERPPPTDPVKWMTEELGEHVWSLQRKIAWSVVRNRRTIVPACHGPGKALDPETPLPTPTGWTTIGEVRAGDELLDERGHPCRVVATAEWSDRPRYRVGFSDKTSVVADAEHEWSVTRFKTRHAMRQRLRTRGRVVEDWRRIYPALAQLVTTRALRACTRTSYGQGDAAVPLTEPLDLPERAFPVDPWVLGLYLADGTRANGTITVARHEAEWIEPRLGGHRRPSQEQPGSFVVCVPGLLPRLRALGALDPKRIPPLYLRASFEQRLAVLRGVMDGDGFVADTSAGIDLTHEALAHDVVELMRSLGLQPYVSVGSCYLDGRYIGPRWRINCAQTLPLFSLPTKLRERPSAQRCRLTHRMVTSVEPLEPGPTKCVEVDSPSHLFLAGEGMVPTHNSFIASRIAAWWEEAHDDPFIVTTAPTGRQVAGILWREINRAHQRGGLRGAIQISSDSASWSVGPPGARELVGWGRKPQDLKDATQAMQAFQGIHALNVLVILDEATGVPGWLWDAAETLMTNENARLLAIGNPDDPSSRFVEECAPGTGNEVIRISAYQTPNFTGEPVPEHLRMLLTSKLWVAEREAKWGRDNPLFQSKVLAIPPDMSDDNVISPALVRAAWERDLPGDEPGAYGLDVARLGKDKTVLYRVRGGVARLVAEWSKARTDVTVDKVESLTSRTPGIPIVVDADGIGGSVYDFGVRGRTASGRKLPMVPFTVQSAVRQPRRFKDRRSEIWWEYRERMEDGIVDLDPEDLDLAAQLQQPKWDNPGGRIRVETKEEMAKRGLPSPDRADACIMAEIAAPPWRRPPTYAEQEKRKAATSRLTAGLRKKSL